MDKVNNKILIKLAGVVGLLVVFILLANWYISVKEETFLAISRDVVYEQEMKLGELSKALANGSAPSNSLILDCSQSARYRFDELLSRLSDLNRSELVELDSLFGGCAYYFSTVKAVKADNLEMQVNFYRDNLRVLAAVDDSIEGKIKSLDDWNNMVDLSKDQARKLAELVLIQSEIIDLLLAYNSANSEEVQEKVAKAQEVRENFVFIEQQIEELRNKLANS